MPAPVWFACGIATGPSGIAHRRSPARCRVAECLLLADVAEHVPPDYVWPDAVTPERTSLLAGDPDLTRLDGLKAALQGEKRGYEFYVAVAATTDSPEVANMANQFVSEEAEHVKVLESWINREEWLSKNPLKTDA